MKLPIVFIDVEVNPQTNTILDIGCLRHDGAIFHKNDTNDLLSFVHNAEYICGHNIFQHDLKFLQSIILQNNTFSKQVIDTLYLSPLLFASKPYHSLLKDDKLQTDELSNPLNDAIKAKDLFFDELSAFSLLDEKLKIIYAGLLQNVKEFCSFFNYINYKVANNTDIVSLIKEKFKDEICHNVNVEPFAANNPIALAYALALTNSFIKDKKLYSITPPWVLKQFNSVEVILNALRNKPCVTGCTYCNKAFNTYRGLKNFFGYSQFRNYNGEPLQEKAVEAALRQQSLLAIFPTGGGKSITFQLPALMSGENYRGLTVVISPLQSLMKDQVDNLEKAGITQAVTINGLLDPIERAKAIERVQDGSASLLYISPELLRSKTIERIILSRKIARFVIDEAHCFSAWGQDFRVDYLYIATFIKELQQKKNLQEPIPVSCFTATAKQNVIEDICNYFTERLGITLKVFSSSAARTNLAYNVFYKESDEEKYATVRTLLEQKKCPTIIYVSRTKRAVKLTDKLQTDGFNARAFFGKMDQKEKQQNQNEFIEGEVDIMVATSAFGMGVDKKDIGMVIHYDISDSLENYVQESGRAGRNESLQADCYVLFNEEDLSKHFILLNQTKLSIKEIQQVWKAIKDLAKFRKNISNSALEIARKAGWDDNIADIETRVTTAIAALEEAGYIERKQNSPKIFANSILAKNANEAIQKINKAEKFTEIQKQQAVRIIKKLFSSKSKNLKTDETAESRVDYISDVLGIVKEDVIKVIYLLRDEKILADTKDLTAVLKQNINHKSLLLHVESFIKTELFLLQFLLPEEEVQLNTKELNEKAEQKGYKDISVKKINTILNFWAIKGWIKKKVNYYTNNYLNVISLLNIQDVKQKINKRKELVLFIIEYLNKSLSYINDDTDTEDVLIEFSVHELKDAFLQQMVMFKESITVDDVEDALFYLTRTEVLKIEGGFLVVYNKLNIERLERDNKKRYKAEDYQKLESFYKHKVQQIHIVGEYAKKMLINYKEALQFVEDYFQLNYSSFIRKYFKGKREDEINQTLTPEKFQQLFGELSTTQLKIIKDSESKYIVVAAGPGSGKTKILVHKLASLMLLEDVKHEQLLMLTFSRAAATEFKKRLVGLIGNAAHYIEIKTFHAYCFDLLGKVGSLEKSETIIRLALEKIKNNEVELSRLTKTVLVIDEAQDISEAEFNLITTLMNINDDMRVIAVGDDDQNIYEFRGSDSKYLQQFITNFNATKYELIDNYRSTYNIVALANNFIATVNNRLKNTPINAVNNKKGTIQIVNYKSDNLLLPFIHSVINTSLAGSTVILTTKNFTALQLSSLLSKEKVHNKLIQDTQSFNLYNLFEIRYFLQSLQLTEDIYVINEDVWQQAKEALTIKFSKSNLLEPCLNLIKAFEVVSNQKKYKTDLIAFIKESKLEDFYVSKLDNIIVSTIHKAKGKEFDNVFLLLENHNIQTDEDKRAIYVAMTRAKSNLYIHYNKHYNLFSNIVGLIEVHYNNQNYPHPNSFIIQLNYKQVWLSYFINKQHFINKLYSGEDLIVHNDECLTTKNQSVLKFSKSFLHEIEQYKKQNYRLATAKVNLILFWKPDDVEHEILIVLPELVFQKINS